MFLHYTFFGLKRVTCSPVLRFGGNLLTKDQVCPIIIYGNWHFKESGKHHAFLFCGLCVKTQRFGVCNRLQALKIEMKVQEGDVGGGDTVQTAVHDNC